MKVFISPHVLSLHFYKLLNFLFPRFNLTFILSFSAFIFPSFPFHKYISLIFSLFFVFPSCQHATRSILEHLCKPLQHLRTLDDFLLSHSAPHLDPPTPSTVMAYTSGLQHWRQAFIQHLRNLEDKIKHQGKH